MHSPILMTLPGAEIYELTEDAIDKVRDNAVVIA